MRRVVVIAAASASGKTTLGRELARRLDAPFHELDALNHHAGWIEATPDELRAAVDRRVAEERRAVDGAYMGKLGMLVLDAADTIVWLDLPLLLWLPRLLRRTMLRIVRREELWNGNTETLRGALGWRDGVVTFALRNYRRRRREYPERLAPYPVVRLRSTGEVERWLAGVESPDPTCEERR